MKQVYWLPSCLSARVPAGNHDTFQIGWFKSGLIKGMFLKVLEGCILGWVTAVITLNLEKQGKGVFSTTWKKTTSWRGATLSETMTFSGGGGHCQCMVISQRELENKYPDDPCNTLPYPFFQCLAGLSVGPTKQKGKRCQGVFMMFSIQVLLLDQKDTVQKFGELTGRSIQEVERMPGNSQAFLSMCVHVFIIPRQYLMFISLWFYP